MSNPIALISIIISSMLMSLGAQANFEEVIVTPWKEAQVTVLPNMLASKITLSHIAQRTKVHEVRINHSRTVYRFSEDRSIPDNRGQINEWSGPTVIDLGEEVYISSVQIVAEGWNRPENGNLFRISVTNEALEEIRLSYEALWTGYRARELSFNTSLIESVEVTTTGRTRLRQMELITPQGVRFDLMTETALRNDNYVDGVQVLELPFPVEANKLILNAESYKSGSDNTFVVVKLSAKGAAPIVVQPLRCHHDGVSYTEGQTWETRLNDRRDESFCAHGGNKANVYKVYQPKVCSGGVALNNGANYERFSTTVGSCNDAPVAVTCTTRRGVTQANWSTWTATPPKKTISETAFCPRGGSKVEIYQTEITRQCQNGAIVTLSERKGHLIRTEGECRRDKRKCGRRSHGATWEDTGRTRTETRSCGRNGRGTQSVTQTTYHGKRCDDGRTVDTTTSTRESNVGQCIRPQNRSCGSRAHGATWEVDTGRTRNQERSCGRKGKGKQTVTLAVYKKLRCDNGSEVNTGRSTKEKSVGRCVGGNKGGGNGGNNGGRCKNGTVQLKSKLRCSAGQGGNVFLERVCRKGKWKDRRRETCDGNDNVGGGGDGF